MKFKKLWLVLALVMAVGLMFTGCSSNEVVKELESANLGQLLEIQRNELYTDSNRSYSRIKT